MDRDQAGRTPDYERSWFRDMLDCTAIAETIYRSAIAVYVPEDRSSVNWIEQLIAAIGIEIFEGDAYSFFDLGK